VANACSDNACALREVSQGSGREEGWDAVGRERVERGYGYCRFWGSLRLFGTLSQAIAIAADEAGFMPRIEQIESRTMNALAEAYAAGPLL